MGAQGVESPDPYRVRQARLRYLGTLHACHDIVTWDILNADAEWCGLIKDDLHWMWQQLANSSALQPPDQSFESWRYLWLHHRPYWKGLIKRAIQHAVLQRHNDWVVQHGHQSILDQLYDLRHVSLPRDLQQTVQSGPSRDYFGCMLCGQSFKTKAGEGAHMFRKHGTISDIRYLFDQTRCEICMKEYFTFSKLHNHLRNSQHCRVSLQSKPQRVVPQEGHGSQLNRKMEQLHDGLLPPLVSQGPCLPPVRLREIEEFDVELYSECVEVLMEVGTSEDKFRRVCALVRSKAIAWTKFLQTMHGMKTHVSAHDLEAFGLCQDDFTAFIDRLVDPFSWPWFQHAQTEKHELVAHQYLAYLP